MNTIEINDLKNEVTAEEATTVVGGYRYKLKDVIVTSYSVNGSSGATRG